MSLRRQPTLRLEQTSTVRRTSKLGWAYRRRAQVFCVVALHQDTRAHADRLPLACVAAASRQPSAAWGPGRARVARLRHALAVEADTALRRMPPPRFFSTPASSPYRV